MYDQIDDVEIRGFKILDQYLTWLQRDGCKVDISRSPLCVSVTYEKTTHRLRVRERLATSWDDSGKQILVRTGKLCVVVNGNFLIHEPEQDLLDSFPRVLKAVKRQGVDTDLLREMHLERTARHQFEGLIAPGPSSYEERVRDTVRQFQRMASNYAETRRAVDLLNELEAAASAPDAATIEILKEYIRLIDPLAHGSDVALRLLTYVLHGHPQEEPSRFR
ncbi:hypothetical protein [Shinella sp. M31]|uniref:hypothetical protein n=1 Tax=Shinella sp. M31 TaxID=3368615 RepID=UPI003BA0B7EB